MSDNSEENGSRDAKGRFGPGNPGKPKGARHALGEAFIKALHDDFEKHGVATIETVRTEKPDAYVKVIASLLPKEFKIETVSDLTVEGFFGNSKRSIDGTHHQVSPQHLHLYAAELDFKYNTRKVTDGERTRQGIGRVVGKRLIYRAKAKV